MEADLQRFYGIDYRDRWRGSLPLRRIWVLIKHLPRESAIADLQRDGQLDWSIEAHLLDDIRITLADGKSKPHPQRPKPSPKKRDESPERRRKFADARRRARARRTRLASQDAEKGTTTP